MARRVDGEKSFRHPPGVDEGGGDGEDHERGGVDGHRYAGAERTDQKPAESGGADEDENVQGLLCRDRLGELILADHSGKQGRPGGSGQRPRRAQHGDQDHGQRHGVQEDERDRGRDLDQATRDEEVPGVMGVDESPDRAGEQQLWDDPSGEQHADLVGARAVGLQAQGQGDERQSVAECRHHAPDEGDDQVTTAPADVQHSLNSIC